MSRRLEEAVAKNRDKARRLETYEVRVGGRPQRDYSFDGQIIEVDVTADVYTRPLNDTLVFGHPDAANGFGRGVFGDGRGSWTQAASVSATNGEFTRGGRAAVADALEGAAEALESVSVGTGTAPLSTGDTDLAGETGSTGAWGDKTAANETRGVGSFRFDEVGSTVEEVGIDDSSGRLMARLITGGVATDAQTEVRVDIKMEFSGFGAGTAVVTSDGEEAVADSIRSYSTTVGLEAIAIGTDGTAAAKSDTALGAEVARKNAARERLTDAVRAFTKFYKSEPSTQPHDIAEMGVFDNNGRLVFRVAFAPFEKNDGFAPSFGVTIRVV